MRRAGFGPGLPADPRRAVRDQLSRMRAPGLGVAGATGVTWFDDHGSARKPVTIGQFAGRLISSLRQLRLDDGAGPRELPVVYAGILPQRIERVGDTFDVDADLWFRYQGAVPVDDVVVTGGVEPIALGQPAETATVDGIAYRRYRVHGRFRALADGARAAQGRVGLAIGVHHRLLPEDRLIFVPDSVALPEAAAGGLAQRLASQTVLPAGLTVADASLGPDLVERPTLGNPQLGARGAATVRLPGVALTLDLGPESPGLRRRWLDDRAQAAALALAVVLVVLLLAERRPPLAGRPRLWLLLLAGTTCGLLLVGESAALQLLIELGGQRWLAAAMRGVNLLWWVAVAGLLLSAVRRLVWRPLETAAGRPVPRVIKTFVAGVVVLFTVFGVLGNVFDRDVTGLVATSGVFAAVLGFALQSNIASVFSGIALNLERPIRPGDWAKIGDAPVAQVVDISWRSTKIKTFANTTISIPNAIVAGARIENFSYPENRYFIFQILHFDPAHDPAQLTDLLYDALRLAPSVDGRERLGLMWVKFNGVDVQGARFLVAFDCTDRLLMNSQEHQVLISIHQTLRRAGVTLATQRTDVRLHETPEERLQPARAAEDLVDDIDLFRPLADADRQRLAASARRRVFAAGETVFAQGEAGRSLFLVAEGVVGVGLATADGGHRELARFGPGSFFGEMALLTGEARSTSITALGRTVLYEVDKAAVAPILDANPELMERLSEVVAERQLANVSLADQATRYEDAHRSLSRRILGRVRQFFGERSAA